MVLEGELKLEYGDDLLLLGTGDCGDANQKPRSHDTSRIAWARPPSGASRANAFTQRSWSLPSGSRWPVYPASHTGVVGVTTARATPAFQVGSSAWARLQAAPDGGGWGRSE